MKNFTRKETQYRKLLFKCRWMLYRDCENMKETTVKDIVSMIAKIDVELKLKAMAK